MASSSEKCQCYRRIEKNSVNTVSWLCVVHCCRCGICVTFGQFETSNIRVDCTSDEREGKFNTDGRFICHLCAYHLSNEWSYFTIIPQFLMLRTWGWELRENFIRTLMNDEDARSLSNVPQSFNIFISLSLGMVGSQHLHTICQQKSFISSSTRRKSQVQTKFGRNVSTGESMKRSN